MFVFDHIMEVAAIIMFGVGFMILLMNNNLIKKIVGLNIMDSSIFFFFVAIGYVEGGYAPIYTLPLGQTKLFVNPIPSGLILTGIVVAVSTTAFALAMTIKLYEKYGTVELDRIMELKGDEHG